MSLLDFNFTLTNKFPTNKNWNTIVKTSSVALQNVSYDASRQYDYTAQTLYYYQASGVTYNSYDIQCINPVTYVSMTNIINGVSNISISNVTRSSSTKAFSNCVLNCGYDSDGKGYIWLSGTGSGSSPGGTYIFTLTSGSVSVAFRVSILPTEFYESTVTYTHNGDSFPIQFKESSQIYTLLAIPTYFKLSGYRDDGSDIKYYLDNGSSLAYCLSTYQSDVGGYSGSVSTCIAVEWGGDARTINVTFNRIAFNRTLYYKKYTDENVSQTISLGAYQVGSNAIAPSDYGSKGRYYTFKDWVCQGGTYDPGDSVPISAPNTSLVLDSEWDGIVYTISFVNEGSTQTVSGTYPNPITVPTAPDRARYTFLGWKNGSLVLQNGASYCPTVATGDVRTFTADWLGNTYTATFTNPNGSAGSTTLSAVYPNTITIPSAGTRTHYTFSKWSSTYGDVQPGATVQLTENRTYTAQWTAITYTVTFQVKHGGSSVISTITQTGTVNDTLTVPSPPTWQYHTFSYWVNGSVRMYAGNTYSPNQNITYTDVFSVDNYVVTFYPGTGGTVSPTSISGNGGTTFTYPLPTRQYYTFTGWYTAYSGGTKIANANETGTITGTASVYAQWVETSYTYTYEDGGTPASASGTHSNGILLRDAVNVTDKTFRGWYNASSGGTLIGYGGTRVYPTQNMSIYARYEDNYILYFYRNHTSSDNTLVERKSVSRGDSISLPSQTTKEYYHSMGWNTARNGSGTNIGAKGTSFTPTANGTYYGQWGANPTVTFVLGNGSANVVKNTINDSAPYVIKETDFPSNPTKQYYHYQKWNSNSSGSGTDITKLTTYTQNSTAYAIYTEVRITSITVRMEGVQGNTTTMGVLGMQYNLNATYTTNYNEAVNISNLTWTSSLTSKLSVVADSSDKTKATAVPSAYDNSAITISCSITYGSTTISGTFTVYITTTYVISFLLEDGSTYAVSSVSSSGAIQNYPTNPTKEGYVFDSWLTVDLKKITQSSILSGNTSVTAYWIQIYDEFDKDNIILQLYNYEGNAITKQFSLGTITSFSDSFTPSIIAMPTPTKDSSKTMITDASGISEEISVECERQSPLVIDDTSDDYHYWSNRKWMSELTSLVDRWQSDTDGIKVLFLPNDCKAHTVATNETLCFGQFYRLIGTSLDSYTTGFRYRANENEPYRWYQGVNALISNFTPKCSSDRPDITKITISFTIGGMKANYVGGN